MAPAITRWCQILLPLSSYGISCDKGCVGGAFWAFYPDGPELCRTSPLRILVIEEEQIATFFNHFLLNSLGHVRMASRQERELRFQQKTLGVTALWVSGIVQQKEKCDFTCRLSDKRGDLPGARTRRVAWGFKPYEHNFMELPDMFPKAYLVGKSHRIKGL